MNACNNVRKTQREFVLFRESLGVSKKKTFSDCTVETLSRIDRRQCGTRHAQRQRIGYWGRRGRGRFIAAKTGFLGMIQDAAVAGHNPKQPLVAPLDAVIEAASAVVLQALDGAEIPTARLHL